jgi:hypothetical protein
MGILHLKESSVQKLGGMAAISLADALRDNKAFARV